AMNVRGVLVFTDGYLVTTATNILGLTNTASVSGASNNSFVSGPVFKIGNQSFVFPVGKNVVYAPLAISAPVLATEVFTTEYFQASPDPLYNVSSLEVGLDHVSQCEYWMLDRTIGSSDVTVDLSWDTRSCGITNMADLRVARWDGTQWTNKGNGGTTGTFSAGTIVSFAPVTGFGPFTLSSVSSGNPLPVETIDFAAQCEGNNVLLTWSTVSEHQNDFFTVESSRDAVNWTTISTVNGAGSSSVQINYSFSGISAPGENLYYRLKQTDFDGNSIYYNEIVYHESCGGTYSENEVLVYPNPAKNKVLILTNEEVIAISVFDAAGKLIDETKMNPEEKWVDFTQLSEGVYIMEIMTATQTFNQQVVISGY
ncbi:MAG: T9SS type A sorting domain-containing protein, partial [Flavobacteriia bacterium]|nr:T9SS type A sorting domain-containing protein [Flavobacteriia bacterium]